MGYVLSASELLLLTSFILQAQFVSGLSGVNDPLLGCLSTSSMPRVLARQYVHLILMSLLVLADMPV